MIAFGLVEPANLIRLPVVQPHEHARECAEQPETSSRWDPLSWIDTEAKEGIFFFVSLIVIDALAMWGALWLTNQPFMGGPFN